MSRKPAINYVIILVFMLYIMGISIPGMSQSDAASKTKPAPPTEQVDPNPVPDPVDPTPIDPEPTIQAANIKPAAKPTADVVTLNKTSTTIFAGDQDQLTATSTISNSTFKWQSSNPSIATVDKNGLVRGISPGAADITVTSNKGGTATCSVTVTGVAVTGVTLDQTSITLTAIGQTRTLTATVSPTNATDKTVTWSSLDPAVATVDAAGIVTAVAEGNTSVTATTVDGGFTASCTVTVDPTVLLVPVTGVTLNQTVMALTALGAPGTLTATVAPADATNASVTWLSSDILVATVAGGVVTPLKPGTTIITATTVDGGFTATCTVTVSPPVKWIAVTGVTLDQATMTLATMGTTGTLIATVAPLNASDPTVYWSSSDIAVATVAGGIVTPLAPGTSTITATTVDGNFTAACLVTVQDITATPVINTPVASAQTSVSGTAEADSVITLSINGTAQPTVTAAGGIWTVIDLTLAVGDIIEVTAQAPDKWVSAAASTTVAEAQPPVIQLIGSDPDSVTVGSTVYADPGAVANDPIYGNLTSSIEVTGTVDTNTVGSYTLTYTVTNPATISRSVTRTVDVVDTLDPNTIDQFVTPLLVPWAMPKSPSPQPGVDYYEIAMRQFDQQILPAGMPATTVWGYGSATDSGAVFNAPSLTIEAKADRPVRVKWINDLIDDNGNYLPHLLPIDQTLHWANPPGGLAHRDMMGDNPAPYVGPVPIVTHVHGAHVSQESDGYPEAWYLPAANSIPTEYATTGTFFDIYKATAQSGDDWQDGAVVYDYPNDQRPATIWYHDHALGMTRTNVYTGPAGFYLVRGTSPEDVAFESQLPSGNYEIPIAIQDRSFNEDGSLFYPDSRTHFDGFDGPYVPDSDIAPIWNPEFFGNTIIANGNTWPYKQVEQRQYRFRFLNGSQSRTLILKLSDGSPFWQIGSDGGYLPQQVMLDELLMGPAERADVLIDFSAIPAGTSIILENIGPDGPYQGGIPGIDFDPADPDTTGKVMEFRVIAAAGTDPSTPASDLTMPTVTPLGSEDNIRQVSLNEEESESPATPGIAPKAAKLGILDGMGMPVALAWMDPVTEVVSPGDTEIWEIYNATMDAHPIHLHLVTFEVIERQDWDMETGDLGEITPAQSWEAGFKDTVLAFPGQVTRIKAKFDMAGRYVWHCHILEHEDNEMMRPYLVAPPGSDTRAPVITVLGNNPETVALNSTYIDAGAAAVDNFDGNVSHNIVVDNQVDTAVAGMYMVHYSVTDSSGNTAMAMRTVMVTDEGPMARMLAAEDGEPVISLNKQVLSLTALGKNGKLKVDIDAPDDSELELVWSSSDPDVATVEDGIVAPLSAGVAIITVSTEDGSYSASCEVTVLPPSTKGKRK